MSEESQTVSVEEAGRLLGLNRGTAYAAARSGDIPAIKVLGRVLVPKAWLRQVLQCDPWARVTENVTKPGDTTPNCDTPEGKVTLGTGL